MYDVRDSALEHLKATAFSSFSQAIAVKTLLNGRTEWSDEIYAQLAQILSSVNNVESAGVPFDLKVSFDCFCYHPTALRRINIQF